jgi:NADPH:quinone reductase-like Zn-dependent oxidoreductase
VRAVVSTPDGPSRTELRDGLPEPQPAADEAIVEVRAFAVNRGELALLAARDEWIPGQDVAGTVVRAAADGSGPAEGTRVAGLAEWHGWAERVAVPTVRLAPLPDGVAFEQAAALPMAATTAIGVLHAGGPLLGRRVLVTGASGGVGRYAVQLAALGGARVTAVARGARAEAVRGLGADAVVAATADAEDGAFDVVLESDGGASLTAAVAKVAHGGTVVVFGNSAREPSSISFPDFAPREAAVRSYFSFHHAHLAGRRLELLLRLVADGRLDPGIGLEAAWSEIEDALQKLSERAISGKVVLRVS